MLQGIHDISKPVGLKMYLRKTNVMRNKHVIKDDVIVDGKKIEEVGRDVYLGPMVTKDRPGTRNEQENRTGMECIL